MARVSVPVTCNVWSTRRSFCRSDSVGASVLVLFAPWPLVEETALFLSIGPRTTKVLMAYVDEVR